MEKEIKLFNLLKQKGYKHYTSNTIEDLDSMDTNKIERRIEVQLAIDWIEKNYPVDIQVIVNWTKEKTKTYRVGIVFINDKNQIDTVFLRPDNDNFLFIEFKNREEAKEAAIIYVLENLIK